GVDDEGGRRVELRGEGLRCCRKFGLKVAQDFFPDLLLELFSVLSGRWRRDRCRWRHRGSRRGTEFLNRFLLLPYLFLHLAHLFLHGLQVAPQLLSRRVRSAGLAERSLGKYVRRKQTHRANNEPLCDASHTFLLCNILVTPPNVPRTTSDTREGAAS